MLSAQDFKHQNAINVFTGHHRKNYGQETVTNSIPPTMDDILQACEGPPRLFTLRDSPVKSLLDTQLPKALAQDYYIAVAVAYLKEKVEQLDCEEWVLLVERLFEIYDTISKPLDMTLLMDSPLWSPELKSRLRQACSQYLSETLSPKFNQARRSFYINACRWFEIAYAHDQTILLAPAYEAYDPAILCATLDQNLPPLVDAAHMSDDLLQTQIDQLLLEDPPESMDWLSEESSQDPHRAIGEFTQICLQANMLGLAPQIDEFVYDMASERFQLKEDSWDQAITQRILRDQMQWMRLIVLPWYSHTLQEIDPNGSQVRLATRADWYAFLRSKIVLEHIFYKAFYDSRVERIFDIITEYPASNPVVEDLKIIADKNSSEKATQRASIPNLIKDAVLKEFRTRLLRNGTWAADILQQYILCIQCLKVIDPSCAILVPIIQVVRDYWSTKREDVVPAVVDMIREGEEYGLDDDNIYEFKEGEIEQQEKDEREQLKRLQQMALDPIAMLISICGSTTAFVEEYQEKLSKALLLTDNYDTDEEMIKLEMLKRRFPENTMTSCDIMIKDIAESRRLDRQIHEDAPHIQPSFHGMILSRHYWPEKEVKEPMALWDMTDQQQYEAKFKHYKANRKLHWTPAQGAVSIELEFQSRTVEMTTDPISALVISVFQGKDQRHTDEEIASKINVDLDKVMNSLEYWEKEGIIVLASDCKYQLVEE
ncbi:hypothetical protein BJV82DRAFT_672133 [Fennellomyces sp. T-0311]|nr:hypothetical protein BJV82DRAFT_672133 [Fennellomyces sp. T-0311]